MKAIEGIERAKKYKHLNIFINCVMQKGNINRLKEMARLAKKLGVKITFEMMETIKNYNERFVPSRREVAKAVSKLIQLKKAGYPIANSSSYFQALAERRKYSCQVPKVLVTVYWDGSIRLCSNIAEDAKSPLVNCQLGNVTEKSFADIFRSRNYHEFIKAAERCWRCNLSYPREIALSFDPDALWNFVSKIF